MTTVKDERMKALTKLEKEKMANPSVGLVLNGDTFIFEDASPNSLLWIELRKLLDELAEFRAKAWIANHFKEKSKLNV
jgi:hypothetical protein